MKIRRSEMDWPLTAILSIFLVEFLGRLPFLALISEISSVGQKSIRILQSKAISDRWKEKVLLVYAGYLFLTSIKLAGMLIVFVILLLIFIFLFDSAGMTVGHFLKSWTGVSFYIAVATIYSAIRKYAI